MSCCLNMFVNTRLCNEHFFALITDTYACLDCHYALINAYNDFFDNLSFFNLLIHRDSTI